MIQLFEGASHAQAYALFRPKTPELIAKKTIEFMKSKKLQSKSDVFDCAVDVGCGSGQSTSIFAPYFKTIIGIDPSEKQIEQAKNNNVYSHITYKVGQAENLTCLENIDLVASGQAVHWMNFEKFFNQCNRVLKPEGCLLIHGYDRPKLYPNFKHDEKLATVAENLFSKFYSKCLFHPRRKHIDNRYVSIYDALKCEQKLRDDSVVNTVECSLFDFVSYLKTWSGYHAYLKNLKELNQSSDSKKLNNEDILQEFLSNLIQEWKLDVTDLKQVSVKVVWSHFMILSKKPYESKNT